MNESTAQFLDDHMKAAMHAYKVGNAADTMARLKACLAKVQMENGDWMPPLFIPLKREYFEAFETDKKKEEFRPYGRKWNEFTCAIGRPVVLSFGYGKSRRLSGQIVSFRKEWKTDILPGWFDVYGPCTDAAACIGIRLWKDVAGARIDL